MEAPEVIDRVLARAAVRWPSLAGLDRGTFAAHLASVSPSGQQLEDHGDDLALVAACLAGLPGAIRDLEQGAISAASLALSRFSLDEEGRADLLQELRVRLLVGPPPRLASYRAYGSLAAWVRMSALRLAIDYLRTRKPKSPITLDVAGQFADARGDKPDRSSLVAWIEKDLEASLRSLTPKERTLLKLHFINRVGIDQLARLEGVHRATVARQLIVLRGRIFQDLVRRLKLQMDLPSEDIRSLCRSVMSEVHVSLSAIMSRDQERPAGAAEE